MESPLIRRMSAAADAVGAMLAARPVPEPATTMAEFREIFAAVDAEASALLRHDLNRIRPGIAWADDVQDQHESDTYWLVDVTDGAVQYLQGLPQWCVSIALVEAGITTAAVIHNPILGETYTAEPGGGAWRNGVRISPSRKTELAAAIAATSHPPFITDQPAAIPAAGAALSVMLRSVGAIRNLGPTSWQVADTAAGRIDVFWEFGHDAENLVGAALIAQEAGAAVTDAEGRPWTSDAASIVVTSPALHSEVVGMLGGI